MMNEEKVYEGLAKIEKHDEDLKELKSDMKELKEKTSLLAELSMSIKTLAENLKDVKETVTDIKKDQNSIKDEVAEIRQFPANQKSQMFDKIMLAIIAAIGGGILTFVLKTAFPTLFG